MVEYEIGMLDFDGSIHKTDISCLSPYVCPKPIGWYLIIMDNVSDALNISYTCDLYRGRCLCILQMDIALYYINSPFSAKGIVLVI